MRVYADAEAADLEHEARRWPRDEEMVPPPRRQPAVALEQPRPRICPDPTEVRAGYEWNLMGAAVANVLYRKDEPALPYEWPSWSVDARAVFVSSIEGWISTTRHDVEHDRRLVARALTVIDMAREYDDGH